MLEKSSLQVAQKGSDARPPEILRSEAYSVVRRNDEG
jgi:hypothetical protein